MLSDPFCEWKVNSYMKYRSIKENRIYTEEQLRSLFRLAEYNGWHDDFEAWVKMEIEEGCFEVVEEEQ